MKKRNKITYKVLGILCVILGAIGIPTPILPTTPFLLLAAYLFIKSDPKLYQKLIQHRVFGKYISNYREHNSLPLKSKIISISTLWITLCISAYFTYDYIWILFLLGVVGIGVTIHLLKLKSKKKD